MSTSEKNIEALRKTIEEQKKILNFFQSKYREQTGSELELPQTWSKFLSISEANAPLVDEGDKLFQSTAPGSRLGATALHASNLGASTAPGMAFTTSMFEGRNFLQSYYDLKLPKKKPDPKSASRAASSGPSKLTAAPSAGSKKSAVGKKKKDSKSNFMGYH